VGMDVRISAEAEGTEAGEAVASLFRWFRRDEQLAEIELSLVAQREVGAQGGAFEVINALIGDGVGLGSLALSFAAWRRAHRVTAAMTVERDGVKIRVEDASPETVSRLVDALSDVGPPSSTASPQQPDELSAP